MAMPEPPAHSHAEWDRQYNNVIRLFIKENLDHNSVLAALRSEHQFWAA
jgi:hypothetical protein